MSLTYDQISIREKLEFIFFCVEKGKFETLAELMNAPEKGENDLRAPREQVVTQTRKRNVESLYCLGIIIEAVLNSFCFIAKVYIFVKLNQVKLIYKKARTDICFLPFIEAVVGKESSPLSMLSD